MPDLLQNGMHWLASQLQQGASQAITYQRGETSVQVLATLGQSEFPRESRDGLTVEERTQDFLIQTTPLILAEIQVTPEPGDRISVPGVGTFEVCSPGAGSPSWRYSDPFHTLLRIHTREVSL